MSNESPVNFRDLATPALTIDLDTLDRNLERMAQYCRKYRLNLRPHTKTHKTPELAHMQVERGAVGVTVAKVGEAEVMAAAGLDNILVAFPVLGRQNLRRLAKVALERRVFVSLDNETAAMELSRSASEVGAKIEVLAEFDAGLRRCGVEPGPELLQLAQKIEKMPSLRFAGLMTYPGCIWGSEQERRREAQQVFSRVQTALEAFEKAGMALEIVSGGSTPSAGFSHQLGFTEIRPGTYVYNDMNTVYQDACRLEDCAARVVTTVISTAVPGRAVIDAGSKALSSDLTRSGVADGYGYVVEAPDAPIIKLNEEHGYLDTGRSEHRFKVGEVLTVIPNHVCTCVNLHDEVFLVRNEQFQRTWRVAARGKIR
jgi:D-serine deaminase-like pyridoxal phosphate-dependent protein